MGEKTVRDFEARRDGARENALGALTSRVSPARGRFYTYRFANGKCKLLSERRKLTDDALAVHCAILYQTRDIVITVTHRKQLIVVKSRPISRYLQVANLNFFRRMFNLNVNARLRNISRV